MEFNVTLFYFITLILLTAFQSEGSAKMDGELRCYQLYAPVCGKDNTTYTNFCYLANQMCGCCGKCPCPQDKPSNCPVTGECPSPAN